MREHLLRALISHAQGHVDKHLANIEIYLNNPVGAGEVGDVLGILDKEFEDVAKYIDQLEIIHTYFLPNNSNDDSSLPGTANVA